MNRRNTNKERIWANLSCLSPFEREEFAPKSRPVVDIIDRPLVTDLFFYMFYSAKEENTWPQEAETQEDSDGPIPPSNEE